jgi:alcohol dehydrogenase (cytochrome c)
MTDSLHIPKNAHSAVRCSRLGSRWMCSLLLAGTTLALSAQTKQTGVQSIPVVGDQWTTYNGDTSGRRFSSLSQINSTNVKNLALAWAFPTRGLVIKGTPLVVDGVVYLTSPDKAWAVDAATGVQLWAWNRPSDGNHIANRGVAYLNGKVYLGTPDAHLICLDAKTGKQVWDVVVADSKFSYYTAVAPLAVKGKIVVGTSGDQSDIPHFLEAFDPDTGKVVWRLDTIPKAGEPGADTWPDEESRRHGGGPLWVTGTYDPALNLMFWGTGNPHPVLAGDVRKGANLYTCSILAIDPDTGKIKWFYQPSPHDTHDWDAVETPVLFDGVFNGKSRRLLAHASRNGYFFLLDRATGEHLLTSQFVATDWAKGLDAKGQPISNPSKESRPSGSLVQSVGNGSTNWMPPSFDPQTGLFYVNGEEGWSFWYSELNTQGKPEDHQGGGATSLLENTVLLAMDYKTGKEVWRRPAGDTRVLAGILTTAGHLLFSGDTQGNLFALDPTTGKTLWHTRPGANLGNGPITYMLDGKQYVAMSAADTMYVFALPE